MKRELAVLRHDGEQIALNDSLPLRLPRRAAVTLTTERRAAFEILTDRDDHGIPVLEV